MFYFKDTYLFFFLFILLINCLIHIFADNEHVEVGYGERFLGDQERCFNFKVKMLSIAMVM